MSDYEYIDDSGDKLRFNGNGHDVLVESDPYVSIPNADVPTVAAELLKAAGQESVIVSKPTVPVEAYPGGDLRCGMTDAAKNATAGWARSRASELLAIAEYIEAKSAREAAEKAEAEAAEKKLTERRDALAKEFTNGVCYFESTVFSTKAAINRIVELEDGTSRD